MSATALGLVLFAALLHAYWNIVAKRPGGDARFAFISSLLLVVDAVRLAPISHVAPAREVSMLFAALIGGHLLGEGDRVLRLAGAGCIAAGVGALALG